MIINLISGRTADSDRITFNDQTLRFTLAPGAQDITDDIRRADKVAIWNIDVDRENQRIFAESYARDHDGHLPTPLDTSTTSIFLGHILTDPLAAPLDVLNRGIDRFVAAPAITKILVAAGVVITIAAVVKLYRESH